MKLTNNYIPKINTSILSTLNKFFAYFHRAYLGGERYRSRTSGLQNVLDGYVTLALCYAQVVRPTFFDCNSSLYVEVNSESVGIEYLNNKMYSTIAGQAIENRTQVEAMGFKTPLSITFLNVPYSTQLKEYVDKLIAHETEHSALNERLVTEDYEEILNATFEYANTKHVVCVLSHNLSTDSAEAFDEQFIVLTSNMSETPMRLVFKAIADKLILEMYLRAALEDEESEEKTTTALVDIYADMIRTMCAYTEEATFDTTEWVRKLVTHYTANQFNINISETLARLDTILKKSVAYKDTTEEKLEKLRNSLDQYRRSIEDICQKMDGISMQQYRAEKMDRALGTIRAELEGMVRQKTLVDFKEFLSSGTDLISRILFKFDTPIKLWEMDEAENYIKYQRNNHSDLQHKFASDMFEAIFLKKAITLYSTCWVSWDLLNFRIGNADKSGSHDDTFQYLPHMHVTRYNCFGTNASYICDALRSFDYHTALAFTMQTAMQYNFGDSTVMGHVYAALCPRNTYEEEWNYNKNKAFLKYKGKFYTPQEFWEWYTVHDDLAIEGRDLLTSTAPSGQATEPATN